METLDADSDLMTTMPHPSSYRPIPVPFVVALVVARCRECRRGGDACECDAAVGAGDRRVDVGGGGGVGGGGSLIVRISPRS